MAPEKKRCACSKKGNTTAAWLMARLKPSNFIERNTSDQVLSMSAPKRRPRADFSTPSPR